MVQSLSAVTVATLAQAQTVVAAPEPREATLTQLRQSYQQARLAALRRQETGTGSARRILAWLDHIHGAHHLARAVVKTALRLAQARQALAGDDPPPQPG